MQKLKHLLLSIGITLLIVLVIFLLPVLLFIAGMGLVTLIIYCLFRMDDEELPDHDD